ncbi:MAG TPA: hypothetical protein VHO69_09970 [Phototrophicaceae bacterium]|nr:hypothetical protein [Phototrophicaceae bacterium]
MAITQQLAMVTQSELDLCKTSETALNTLIWFKFTANRYLDLNWAPVGLQICFEQSGQTLSAQKAFDWSLNGTKVVNPECPEGPPSDTVYSQITFLEIDQVQLVAKNLQEVVADTLFAWIPKDLAEANAVLRTDLTVHPKIYYPQMFHQLRQFYQTAAQNNMATVMWWD